MVKSRALPIFYWLMQRLIPDSVDQLPVPG